jgi:hypothetical protein
MTVHYVYVDADGAEQWATVDVDPHRAVEAAVEYLQADPAPTPGQWIYRYPGEPAPTVAGWQELVTFGAAVLDGRAVQAYSLWAAGLAYAH